MSKEVKQSIETIDEIASAQKAMKRGTVIQAVKAIAVLVCICLVCGALLALCNDIFYISDEERALRAEAKINAALKEVYSDLTNPQSVKINSQYAINANYGKVTKVVKSDDGAYVLAVIGVGGYANGVSDSGFTGSLTALVAINKDAKIVGWKISDTGTETYANDVIQHKDWYIGQEISTDIELIKHGGATYTSTALNNAIKMASYYAMNVLNLGENPEADAMNALNELLQDTDYSDYNWTTSLDTDYRNACAIKNGEDVIATLAYYFTGTKADSQDIAAYAFYVGDETKIVVVKDNVNHADRLAGGALAKSEGIDDAIVNSVLNRSYFEYQVQSAYSKFAFDKTETVKFANANIGGVTKIYYSLDGIKVYEAYGSGDYGTGKGDGVITIRAAVDNDGKLLGWAFVSTTTPTGSAYVISEVLNDKNSKDWYKGDTLTSDIAIGNNATSGATLSSTSINNAIKSIGAYLEQGGSN